MQRTSLLTSLVLLLAMSACRAEKDQPTETGTVETDIDSAVDTQDTGPPDTDEEVDLDADGFAASEDCDDENAAIHPGADETCDGRDNDCDGETDEADATDAITWYADGDGDGFGTDTDPVTSCAQPQGYESHGGDCNDNDPSYNPGALEADCTDPNDYNCDGSVGYVDSDNDDFAACEDCDDSDATSNPAGTEVCDGADNNCDGLIDNDATDATPWYGDSDGDGHGGSQYVETECTAPSGYVASSDDCDDLDANSHPGAQEICDNADNDCDGQTDEGVTLTWYADADGDGFGDASVTSESCAAPAGYSANADDCDDTNPGVSPAATELCDNIDNDCDGTVDEADAANASTFYLDGDGDGHGSGGATAACDVPAGYAASNDDCDDADGSVSPSAAEVCDGIDNDCSGSVDDNATDATTWYADLDGDGYGGIWATSNACSQPSGYVASSNDCNDLVAAVHPGATEVCDGIDNDCSGDADGADATDALTWYVDSDGDGFGSAATTTLACSIPSGYADNSSDCDDGNSAVHPAAPEVCGDNVDNDCSGDADGTDATDALTWYLDSDGDGFGSAATTTLACTQPTGYADNSTDCDDNLADVNPNGTEVCGDGLDNDCSGDADGTDATDALTWYVDSDGDGFGSAATTTLACTQPTGYADNSTDCDDTNASAYACTSCLGVLNQGSTTDGIYSLAVSGGVAADFYCDMTTDGGGWTLVEWVISGFHSTTGAVSEGSLSGRNTHAKLDDSDLRALGQGGQGQALVSKSDGSSTYLQTYDSSAWSSFSSTGWTNQSFTSTAADGSTSTCNGHYNNRGFSTYSDSNGSACPTVFSGSPAYMVTWHTSNYSGGVGGTFGVYIR